MIDWNYLGKLLSSVQADPDATRKAAVKKRVAQYISKAEQLGKEVFRFLLFFLFIFLTIFFVCNNLIDYPTRARDLKALNLGLKLYLKPDGSLCHVIDSCQP